MIVTLLLLSDSNVASEAVKLMLRMPVKFAFGMKVTSSLVMLMTILLGEVALNVRLSPSMSIK